VSDLLERLAAIQERGGRAVLFTVVEGDGAGAKFLVEEGETDSELGSLADQVIRGGRNELIEEPGRYRRMFAEVYMPPPRLFVYGAVDTAEALCKAAKLLGWTTYVADARHAFATEERFPSADHLIVKWPEEAIAEVAPDHQTAFVVLTHDAKFDQPALQGILATEAFYVGALGSRRNQEKRRARLLEAGVAEAELDRIAGPAGLDVGAESQEETALSILGEILAVRAGRPGGRLKEAKRRIHAQQDAPAPA
jgi:xanthine dehydrogenase accessory factor